MDNFGSFKLTWTIGYTGSHAAFVTDDVVCYKCGDNIKFIDSKNDAVQIHHSAGNGIGVLGVHSTNHIFAYSEETIDPKVFVVNYPDIRIINEINDGAKLEYQAIEFSSAELLVTVSGIPDFKLTVWNYHESLQLVSCEMEHMNIRCVSFNPSNWRQLATSTEKYVSVWTLEQNNKDFLIKQRKVKFYANDDTGGTEVTDSNKFKVAAKAAVNLPISAITGLTTEKAAEFEEYIDKRARVYPLTHCWSPSGDILVGCDGGYLKKIDIETHVVETLLDHNAIMNIPRHIGPQPDTVTVEQSQSKTMIHQGPRTVPQDPHHDNKPLKPAAPDNKKGKVPSKTDLYADPKANKAQEASEHHHHHHHHHHHVNIDPDNPDDINLPDSADVEPEYAANPQKVYRSLGTERVKVKVCNIRGTSQWLDCSMVIGISDGSFNQLLCYRNDIYAGGLDGFLRKIEYQNALKICVREKENLYAPITSLSFSTRCSKIAAGSSQGSLTVTNPSNISKVRELVNYHSGAFVAVCSMASRSNYCLTLRENGLLQVWNMENGESVTAYSFDCKTPSMDVSAFTRVAAVGTDTGNVYIVDLVNIQNICIIKMFNLHKGPVTCIKFGYDGNVFVTGSNDGRVYVVNGKASRNFEPVGYTTFSGVVTDVTCYKPSSNRATRFVLVARESDDENSGATKLIAFFVPAVFSGVPEQMFNSLKCDFQDEVINKLLFSFPMPVFGVALTSVFQLCAISQPTSELLVYDLPEDLKSTTAKVKEAGKQETMAQQVIRSRMEYRRTRNTVNLSDKKIRDGESDSGESEMVSDAGTDITEVSTADLVRIRQATEAHGQLTAVMKLMAATKSPVLTGTGDEIVVNDSDSGEDSGYIVTLLESYPGHDVDGGRLFATAHGRWLASCGGDGDIIIRDVLEKETKKQFTAHSYLSGGAKHIMVLPDGQSFVTIGCDGTVCCFKWRVHDIASEVLLDAQDYLNSIENDSHKDEALIAKMGSWSPELASDADEKSKLEDIENKIEEAILQNLIYTPSPPMPKPGATWSETKENEADVAEFMKSLPLQRELREELRSIRKTLLQMLKENDEKPEIEKLPRHEFDLDVEEQRRLQAHCDSELARIREEKEYENLSKLYLTECIKKECWDEMDVKGRGLLSFGPHLEVYNFPLKKRTENELQQLEIIKSRRRVEMAVNLSRKLHRIEDEEDDTDPLTSIGLEDSHKTDSKHDDLAPPETVRTGRRSLAGSLANELCGTSDFSYTQFDLCSREQKIFQIIFIQDVIYQIKEKFNKEFDEVFAKKEVELKKIQERNVRIRKILEDTGAPVEIFEPAMNSIEKPELLFVTTDEEVKVEKYLTAEQRRRLEEERAEAERKRQLEKADNWRERGLDYMMGGVLEVKREDELKKDIPIPIFMQEKAEEEWNDEDKKAAQEYYKKVKDLEEEREKYRKQLEAELNKLKQLVEDETKIFDEHLLKLFMKKIETELVVAQEELKVVRLRSSLLVEEELVNRETELIRLFDVTRKQSQAKIFEVATAKKELEEFRTMYDILLAEDKVMEKSFKREFTDINPAIIEQLAKHFRRRPRGQKAKVSDVLIVNDPRVLNADSEQALDAALVELNHISNKPENCEVVLWEKMCRLRREKMEQELKIRQLALVLAEMQAFIQRRQEEDEELKSKLEQLMDASNKLRETKHNFVANLEIQLLLKQGQVEVEPGEFVPDYSNSLLVDQAVVEDLNKRIRKLGEAKISSMVESKDFRKGILKLEWEHKKLSMEIADLKNKMNDITRMKVTREVQEYLRDDNYFARKNHEVSVVEQTIAAIKEVHEKRMQDKKDRIEELKVATQDLRVKNSDLSEQLTKINVSVNRRMHVYQHDSKNLLAKERRGKYRTIIERRKIIDLAKAQAQEIALLSSEIDRLRMRSFASLDYPR